MLSIRTMKDLFDNHLEKDEALRKVASAWIQFST